MLISGDVANGTELDMAGSSAGNQPHDGYRIMQKRMREHNIKERALKRVRM